MAQVFLVNDLRGIPCRCSDYLLQRHTHIQKLRHHVQLIFHPGIHTSSMQVGANGVWNKTTLERRDCLRETEASTTMTNIENETVLLRFDNERKNLSLRIEDGLP